MSACAVEPRFELHDEPTMVAGSLVRYENRIWRVGLVSWSRARLDPLSGRVVRPDPTTGRCFTSYGDSVNISPRSILQIVSLADLDEAAQRRLARLEVGGQPSPGPTRPAAESEEDDDMEATETTTDGANVSPVPIPAKAGKRATRAAKLAKPPKSEARPLSQSKAAKTKRARKDAAPKEMKPCACGCGEMTAGYFVPGHDAKFKSWLLKIERGTHVLHGYDKTKDQEITPLPLKVQNQFKWVKRGEGYIPTTNYKGEPHKGYDKA